MGADLYESYCGSILATTALGASSFAIFGIDMQIKAIFAPMFIAAVGILLSILGVFLVKTKDKANMKQLLSALSKGVNFAAFFIAIATFLILYYIDIQNYIGISFGDSRIINWYYNRKINRILYLSII